MDNHKSSNGALDYSLYYRTYHDESAEHVRSMVHGHLLQLRKWLHDPQSGAALDIGCGMGFAVLALREFGYVDCQGIDMDPEQVNACRRLGVEAELVTDSIRYLQDRPQKYRVITLLDVLEHVSVSSQVDLLRAVNEALAPGGQVLVQVPNANSPLAARWRYNDFTHHGSFTEHSLRFVLQSAWFDEINIQGYEPVRRPSLRIWRRGVRRGWSRQAWWRWALFLAWRKLIEVELGSFEKVDCIPLTLNMIAVATKAGGTSA